MFTALARSFMIAARQDGESRPVAERRQALPRLIAMPDVAAAQTEETRAPDLA